MKSLLFLLLFITCFYTQTVSGQQWNSYHPYLLFDINAVDILKPGYIVLGGGKVSNDSVQVMFVSQNYGATWNENPGDGLMSCNKSITFSDSVNGFGVGYEGRIIKTADGGMNWGNAVFPIARDFNKVVNASPILYYAVGGSKTNSSMQTILKTTNFGTLWSVIYDNPGPCLNSVYFITTQKGFAVGDSGVILATTNGGGTWNTITAPIQRDFNAITFINADTGFIVGGSQTGVNRRTILQTVDGGANWLLLSDTIGGILYDISFADADQGYLVGDSASLLETTDGGLNWTPQQISGTLAGNEEFRAVKFYDRNFGVIGGKGGVLYVYTGWPIGLFTLGAKVIDSTHADVYASVNTHGLPGAVNFVYSTDSTFASFSTANQSVSSDTFFPTSSRLFGLIPNTWYYYFVSIGSKTGDTLRFYTGSSYPVFKTIAGDVVDSSTLRLRGNIHGIASVNNIKFEYGTSPFLGNVIAASQVTISDTSDYPITALLSSVQPHTIYYYRLIGEITGDTVYGDIYFTGNPFHVLETLPVSNLGDSTATLNGVEQGIQSQVKLNFEYGLAQGPTFETNPATFLNSDSIHYISYLLVGLQPGKLYYYRLKARSGIGINYGKLLVFYTGGSKDSLIKTLPAQLVTTSSAMLEGVVNHFPEGAALSFEYGNDSSLTNSIIASPPTINDSLFHNVSALLSGVPSNMLYYYRLKTVTNNGDEIYGDIRSVYIGNNEIPNWDFQNWTQQTYSVPAGWNIATKDFSRVPGHSGNYAINLHGINLAILGFPSDDKDHGQGLKLLGGAPFTGRPDSLSFYVKGSLVSGDSAAVVLFLHQGNTNVAKNIFKIGVNTGGAFQRVSLPITYQSALMPDSLVLGITTINPDYPTLGNQNNSITVDDFSFIPATATVYNGNFETWFDHTFDLPDSWYSPTFISLDSVNASSIPMVSKTVFYPPYDYAAEVRTMDLNNLGLLGGNLGLKLYPLYGDAAPSFAVNIQHQTLNGFYQAYPVHGDTMGIEIIMYYQGLQVGNGRLSITDSVSQFSQFEIPINYFIDTAGSGVHIPDSACIEIRSYSSETNKARGLSKLVVDKLRFDGFVDDIGADHPVVSHFDESGIKIYPNPSNNLMILEIAEVTENESTVQINNLNGQVQKEFRMRAGEEKTSFSVTDMETGFYLLHWINGNKVVNKKIIVVK